MRNELVRWTKPPRLVTAELVARKDSVGLADLLWVYEAPLAAAALVPPWWLFMLWMSGPFIIEHVPRATGPIPRRYEVRVAAARGRIAKEWLEEPEYDDLTRRFSELELIAEKLENDSYEKVVTEKENHRNALMVRR
jgi:hypothetical protein